MDDVNFHRQKSLQTLPSIITSLQIYHHELSKCMVAKQPFEQDNIQYSCTFDTKPIATIGTTGNHRANDKNWEYRYDSTFVFLMGMKKEQMTSVKTLITR